MDLVGFENKVEDIYKTGKIKGPIHLSGGNEKQLTDIFGWIYPSDYVFCTWRNHYHALLKGITEDEVMTRILEGQSMAMNFPEYNFYTSAIVGGICPIATGVALGIKDTGRKAYCFIGDMAFRTGIAHESIIYSVSEDLPIVWVVEDNGKSVGTPTNEVCKVPIDKLVSFYKSIGADIVYYKYELTRAHSGIGSFVSF